MQLLTSAKTRNERLNICGACEHYREGTRTCGPAVVGATVRHLGEDLHLCGCVMPIKASLRTAACPLGRWTHEVDPELVDRIREFLAAYPGPELKSNEVTAMHLLWNQLSRKPQAMTQCRSCLREMYSDLKKYIEHVDAK